MGRTTMNSCFVTVIKRTRWRMVRGFALLLAVLAHWNVNAAVDDADAEAALQALFGALEQETQIATRTKMNVDFVPGMVSVLYGKDLQNKGVRNAGEALALIPGVELSIASDGQSQVFVRGVGTSFSSGKIKVLFNGVPYNSTLSVAATSLHIPVEQIERIEVIRGPGSTIYGEFAFMGVVNVVTRKRENRVFARYGDLGSKEAGFQLWHENEKQDWELNLSFAGTDIDGDSVESGPDILRAPMFAGVTRAPGPVNEIERDRTAIFLFDYGEFNFSAQWAKVDSGDAFGLAHALPAAEPRIMREVEMLSVQAEQHWSLGSTLDVKAHLGWLDYSLKSGLHELYPPGFAGINPMTSQPFYPNGVIGSPNYEERKYRAGAEANFRGMEGHDWLLGFEWLYTDAGDTYAIRNYNPAANFPMTNIPVPVPLGVYRGDENWLEEGLTRRVWGIYVQDQYSVSEKMTVTAGVRFDSYDDVGSAASPRLAAVYRMNEKHTLKAQYARAFRPPTFLETSTKNNPVVIGNPDIESETIDNFELGYIFNDGVNMLRTTIFHAGLRDLILIDSATNAYANQGRVSVHGLELEFERKFSRTFKLDSTLSVVEAKELKTNTDLADVAHITADLGLIYRPWDGYVFAAQYRYVGQRERATADPRDHLDGFKTLDVTATAEDFFRSDILLRAGVRNMFDADVRYPSPLVSFGGAVVPSYPEDYPRPGREYWLQIELGF